MTEVNRLTQFIKYKGVIKAQIYDFPAYLQIKQTVSPLPYLFI